MRDTRVSFNYLMSSLRGSSSGKFYPKLMRYMIKLGEHGERTRSEGYINEASQRKSKQLISSPGYPGKQKKEIRQILHRTKYQKKGGEVIDRYNQG